MNKPQDFGNFVRSLPAWLLQADTLTYLALLLGVGAWLFFVFAERWGRDGAKLKWAPWMRSLTPASYRRMGHVYAILAVVSATAALIRVCVNLFL